jgi:hypothetical protein
MIDILSNYPFLLALVGAMVIELSAILARRAAQTLGGWLWYLAGVLSSLGAGTLIWSFIWANTPETIAAPRGGVFNLVIGPLLVLSGVVWVIRPLLTLGRQAFFPWPPTRLAVESPYRSRRRPMVLGMIMLAVGLPLTTTQVHGWIWFGVWFLLAQPLLEVEEWELRARLPGAAAYLDRTPRYFKFPKQ